ncbi:hypothetical protein [Microbacterium sp. H1-D42]|uniref:hypothetical protein n=1 Tax=Microbacterium sp. H1-D42 TaxID=2925844 RepID=UPI001F536584|nr:hypothetical protein [Microbacterium sp. H1-D42]UNK69968.1 hypothetical protein MNR00_12435 [Microbacterium sp. H1-D42]
MTHDSDVDPDNFGHVIVSFTIGTAAPIENLVQYLHPSPAPGAEFFYDLGTETFEEPSSASRADKLDATINSFLELVESTPRDALHHPEAFVRLFMTLGRGAETISATTLKRLADVNATVWIDA